MSAWLDLRVVALASRRALGPVTWAAFALVALAAAWIDWEGATGLPRGDATVLRGLERRGLWLAWLGCVGLTALAAAARRQAAWRARELDWIAALPLERRAWLVSTWCGDALSLALLVTLAAGWVELSVGAARPTARVLQTVELPPVVLVEQRSRVEWSLPGAPSNAHARIELALAGGGRAAEVRWIAKRGGLATATAATIGLRTTLELPLPRGDGPVAFELDRLAAGAIVVADPAGLVLLEPVASDRAASWTIAARAWLALAAADALALGLGAWVSAASSFAATAALWIAAWLTARAQPLIPGSDLVGALGQVAAGLVPPPTELAQWVGAAGLVALGLALGLGRPWTREP